MFEKLKSSFSQWDVGHLVKSLKQSITEPSLAQSAARQQPSCELIQVREGQLPAVFIINGFMSEKGRDVKDWLEVVDELYPNNQVIRVLWKAGNFKDMVFDQGVVPDAPVGRAGKFGLAATMLARSNVAGMIATAGGFVVNKVLGHWKHSFHETQHVAQTLAEYIEQNAQFSSCILMGHSLGSRIIRHTLARIDTADRVSVAYLFAGAVSSDDAQWQPIVDKHTQLKLINCMSRKDYVLKTAYKAGTLWDHEPAGLAPILRSHEHVLNLDVTQYASGHTQFKQKELGQYLRSELNQLDPSKQRVLHLKPNKVKMEEANEN